MAIAYNQMVVTSEQEFVVDGGTNTVTIGIKDTGSFEVKLQVKMGDNDWCDFPVIQQSPPPMDAVTSMTINGGVYTMGVGNVDRFRFVSNSPTTIMTVKFTSN